MKKKLADQELCKLWALQTQKSGRGTSTSFEGKDLYVTRTKKIIARFINNELVFINRHSGRDMHHTWVRVALPKNVTFFNIINFTDHSENIKEYKKRLNWYKRRAKKREREFNLTMCEMQMKTILNYIEKNSIEPDEEILGFQKIMKKGGLLTNQDREELNRQLIESEKQMIADRADWFRRYNLNQKRGRKP